MRINTADGTSPASFKVVFMSAAVKVLRGNDVIRANGTLPSVLFADTYSLTVDKESVAWNEPVIAVPFVKRNCVQTKTQRLLSNIHVDFQILFSRTEPFRVVFARSKKNQIQIFDNIYEPCTFELNELHAPRIALLGLFLSNSLIITNNLFIKLRLA